MATLDDKLMGEKLHYYCSSSEDDEPNEPAATTSSRPVQKSSFRRLKQLPSTNVSCGRLEIGQIVSGGLGNVLR